MSLPSFPRGARRGIATSLRLVSTALVFVALAGCSILGGGGNGRDRATIYAPDPRPVLDPALPAVSWQLSLGQPIAARAIDSFRIAVRPSPEELQVYRGAGWAKTPSDMLHDALLRTLEDSGKIPSVARQGSGVVADYKLALDLRRFEADYSGHPMPSATIELNAKLIHGREQEIVASRTFHQAHAAAGTDVPLVVNAFSRSLEDVTRELAEWVLVSGDAHQRARPSSRGAP